MKWRKIEKTIEEKKVNNTKHKKLNLVTSKFFNLGPFRDDKRRNKKLLMTHEK